MTPERLALLERRDSVDREARQIKTDLHDARRQAARGGQHMPREEYDAKNRRLTELQNLSRDLQRQLAATREENVEGKQLASLRQACQEILPRETLDDVVARALELEREGDRR